MDWYDVEDVLYDSTEKKQIAELRCPDCGGEIAYKFEPSFSSFSVKCLKCGYISKSYKSQKPNCVDLLGKSYKW